VAGGLAPARAVPLDPEAVAVAALLADDADPGPAPAAPSAEEGPAVPVAGGGRRPGRQVRLFCAPRPGREELIDAAAGDLARGRFAVACGDPDSVHADLWSRVLVEDFVDTELEQPAAWSKWLPPVQMKWTAAVAETNEPLRKNPEHEARATFLGLVLHGRRWLGRRWEAIAVGDCCLFQVRDGLLQRMFPLSRAAAFSAPSQAIGARTSFEPVLRKHEARAEGDWAEGDQFWLLTRSLARWFLEQVDAWQRPWDALEALLRKQAAERAFLTWVAELRERGAADGDAIALGVCL
jgi:hypothetical protein